MSDPGYLRAVEDIAILIDGMSVACGVAVAIDTLKPVDSDDDALQAGLIFDASDEGFTGPLLIDDTTDVFASERHADAILRIPLHRAFFARPGAGIARRDFARLATVEFLHYGSPAEAILAMAAAAATSTLALLQWLSTRRAAADKVSAEADHLRAEAAKTRAEAAGLRVDIVLRLIDYIESRQPGLSWELDHILALLDARSSDALGELAFSIRGVKILE